MIVSIWIKVALAPPSLHLISNTLETTKNVLTLVDYNQKKVTNQFIGIAASLEHLNIMRFCLIALLKL